MNKTQAADRSIAAYDAFVFASVGRQFDANKADALAAVAVVDCEVAARDRSINQTTRNIYAALRDEFRAII